MGPRKLGILLVVAFLACAFTAKADSVYVNGSYSFASNGYGIPPYGGTLNGRGASFYCVDFSHDITGGMSWNVTLTSLASTNFSATLLGQANSAAAQQDYLEIAYLITQMMTPESQQLQAEDQYAIWSFSGGPDPFGTNASLIAQAFANIGSEKAQAQNFEILTPYNSYGQEFIIVTPEPRTLLLLGIGSILLLLVLWKKSV